jgi:hypothetical protein
VAQRDWLAWHAPYDDPASPLSARLRLVQGHLRSQLDRLPAGGIQLISMCAGQGRDVIGVLAEHPRRGEVRARLVELDPRNVEIARQAVAAAGLEGVEVTAADAGMTDAYLGAVPAQVVLACGVFGNITDDDISRTVTALPTLCAADATVIWTRHRRPPDLTAAIRGWFRAAGYVQEALESPAGTSFAVGVHRLASAPGAARPGQRLFSFVGDDN